MKVVLINPFLKSETHNLKYKKADNVILPLGLCQIASCIEKKGIKTFIIDGQTMCSSWNDFLKKIKRIKPILVGLSVMTSRKNEVLNLAKILKKEKACKFICLGGPHINVEPEFLLEEPFDFGIRGDAEIPFSELSVALSEGKNIKIIKQIKGLVYKQNNKIISNGVFVLENLNSLPFPKFDFTSNLSAYHPSIVSYKRTPSLTLVTSRGCPYNCAFCSSGRKDVKWNAQSSDYVASEMTYLSKIIGIKDIWFFDDTFTVDKKRVSKLCNKIIKNKIDISWGCITRVDTVDKTLLRTMKSAGCWMIGFGLESGNQNMLDLMNKQFTIQKAKQTLLWCEKAGIKVKAYFMMGYPGETKKEIYETINFANSQPIDYVSFYPVNILPGTNLASKFLEFGVVEKNKDGVITFGNEIFVSNKLNLKDILQLQKKATFKFYFRPKYVLKQILSIKSFDDVKKNYYGFKSLF